MIRTPLLAAAALAFLAGCASAQQQRITKDARMATRVLERAGSIGDPGRVAATDFAFARAAQQDGQWTAFRAYAASGALIHGVDGTVDARDWLAQRSDPALSVAWSPKEVWSSCDGTLAVSVGRLETPEGMVGDYLTAWALQDDGAYRWTYDLGALANPQPAAQPEPDVPDDGSVIVVEEMRSIAGRIADCPQDGMPLPPPPAAVVPAGVQYASAFSVDGTLRWTWFHGADGRRSATVDWFRYGDWQKAVQYVAPPQLDR